MSTKTLGHQIEDETTGGVTFRRVMVLMAIAAAVVATVITVINSPKTVTIDNKHWECTATEPNGIEAECTNFSKKKFGLRAQ